MSHAKLGLSALALEIAAWAQLAGGGTSDAALAAYLAGHAAASALLATLAHLLLPEAYRHPRLPVILLLAAFVFFVPAVGFVGVLATVIGLPFLPRFAPRLAFRSVGLPELDPHDRVAGLGFRQSGMRGFLTNPRAPVPMRLRALVALQNVPTRLASPMLRELLADPTEDLRLLAYGMLDSQEKKLNGAIHGELAALGAAVSERRRMAATRRLARLYWELIYQGLVQGDLLAHAAGESLSYTETALAAFPEDPGLHWQHGRLLHLAGRDGDAAAAYRRALDAGMPETRVLPYLAEIAYDARNYAEVRRLAARLRDWPGLPRLAPVVRYWSRT